MLDLTGVFVVGRHLFDVTSGWGGSHPYALEGPVSVVQGERVTHLRYRVVR